MIKIKPTPASRAQAEETIRRIQRAISPPNKELEPVRRAIRAGFARNFEQEAEAETEKWANLSARTVREREQAGYPGKHPILVRSGGYRSSFTSPHDPDHVSETQRGRIIRLIEGTKDPRSNELEGGENIMIPPRPASDLGPASKFLLEEAITAMLDRLMPTDD